MNIPRDPDTVLAAWLEDGPITLPQDTRQAIAVGIRMVPRRRPGVGLTLGGARLGLPDIGLRRVSMALGGAAVVVLASALALGVYDDRPAVGGPVPAADPRDPFLGTWVSTSDSDGGTQTMTVRVSADGAVEITVLDDIASVCSGTSSTMTGTGRIEGSTRLVLPFPVYTCDDGSEPETLSGPPLEEQLRNLTFVRDAQAGNLTDNFGGVWLRQVAATPSSEPTTPPSEAEVAALLNGFLEARVAGEGAQQYLLVPEKEVPLLYATTSGAPYDRAQFERVLGIEWPRGEMAFKVRLFAGETVVEQLLFMGTDGPLGLKYDQYGYATHITPTTEDGQPVAVPYNFFDGEVTLHAAHPWVFHGYNSLRPFRLIPEGPGVRPTTDGGERTDWDHLVLMADPVGTDCRAGPGPADAQALAESIRSDPDLEATAPVAVSAGGARGLTMDVVIAAGTSICERVDQGGDPSDLGVLSPVFDRDAEVHVNMASGLAAGHATGKRMRLYLFDVPEGSSMRILAIAIIAPESRFERVVQAAVPIIESIEFHAPSAGKPSVSAAPSVAPVASTSRFHSTIHGISIDYPSGWETRPATEPWTGGPLDFDSPAADVISFPALGDRAYLVVASQPLGQLSGDAWRDEAIAWICNGSGMSLGSVTADGARGVAISCPSTSSAALISADGRGYLIRLVVSSDEAKVAEIYDGLITAALTTVDLRPKDAVDAR